MLYFRILLLDYSSETPYVKYITNVVKYWGGGGVKDHTVYTYEILLVVNSNSPSSMDFQIEQNSDFMFAIVHLRFTRCMRRTIEI